MDIQIEITNRCQCVCTFCVRPLNPPVYPSVIEHDLFLKIVEDMKEFNVRVCYLTGLGDPFLDDQLEWRITYIKERFPETILCIYTNGILANQERVVNCYEAGLDQIYFSLNAATAKMHEQIMGVKGQFETVEKNLHDSLAIPGLNTCISVVTGTEWVEPGEIIEILKKYPEDKVYPHSCGNWAGKIYKLKYKPQRNECRWITSNIYINIEGEVCHCCLDPYGKFSSGNVKEDSLYNIWFNGQKRQDFLRRLKENGRAGVIPCCECSTI